VEVSLLAEVSILLNFAENSLAMLDFNTDWWSIYLVEGTSLFVELKVEHTDVFFWTNFPNIVDLV
jgi:hypothetical protein